MTYMRKQISKVIGKIKFWARKYLCGHKFSWFVRSEAQGILF